MDALLEIFNIEKSSAFCFPNPYVQKLISYSFYIIVNYFMFVNIFLLFFNKKYFDLFLYISFSKFFPQFLNKKTAPSKDVRSLAKFCANRVGLQKIWHRRKFISVYTIFLLFSALCYCSQNPCISKHIFLFQFLFTVLPYKLYISAQNLFHNPLTTKTIMFFLTTNA